VVGKKRTTIGVRVDDELLRIIASIAEKEQRTNADMVRVLATEALRLRGILPSRGSRRR
jgi:hypothetical protein